MSNRTLVAAATTLGLLVALSGCASPTVLVSSPSTPKPSTAPTDSTAMSSAADREEAAAPGSYVDYYDGAIAETPGLKVLFFYAQWCPKCRALDDDINANVVPDGMTIFKVDFDTALDLRQHYAVTLQTTIVYVDDEGEVLAKGVLYDDTTLDALIAAAP